ncbi:hypothetical protein RE428_34740 [Marinobacter nanhaiticus D15-8W]|nr:hypothetical protein RE428_34740 [Marinobacter nanhaiticus D15-8W]
MRGAAQNPGNEFSKLFQEQEQNPLPDNRYKKSRESGPVSRDNPDSDRQ